MNKITENIGIKGFPVTQNGQDFIIGKATIGEILKYTKYTQIYTIKQKCTSNVHVLA